MKTESLMLITDAREVLLRTALVEATQNPLAAAFLGWLLRREEFITLMEDAATKAAPAKGGERSSRNVAVLGFACGVEKLKARFATAFATLVGVSGEVGVSRARMAVNRYEVNVVALVEDLLRTIAMVVVDVDERDPAVPR